LEISLKRAFITIAFITLSSSALAQESRIETQAARCASLAFILTSVGERNPDFGRAMTDFGQFFGFVYSVQRSNRTSVAVTNGDVNDRQEAAFVEFKKSWRTNPEVVTREAALCNDWRAQVAARVTASGPNLGENFTPDVLLRIVPEPPAQPATQDVEKWRDITQQAFTAWTAMGYATPRAVVEKLRR
jgi:hypothetical protein